MSNAKATFRKTAWNLNVPCGICGKPFISLREITVDHITPLVLGGLDRIANWQPAHSRCNTQKAFFETIEDAQKAEERLRRGLGFPCPCGAVAKHPAALWAHLKNFHALDEGTARTPWLRYSLK